MIKLAIDTQDATEGWNFVGDVSVDTGRIIIADPCYLDQLENQASEIVDQLIETDILEICERNEIDFSRVREDESTLRLIASLMKRFGEGKFPGGSARFVAAQTGFGDGRYPVYCKVEDDRVVGMWIDFECGKHLPEAEEP